MLQPYQRHFKKLLSSILNDIPSMLCEMIKTSQSQEESMILQTLTNPSIFMQSPLPRVSSIMDHEQISRNDSAVEDLINSQDASSKRGVNFVSTADNQGIQRHLSTVICTTSVFIFYEIFLDNYDGKINFIIIMVTV